MRDQPQLLMKTKVIFTHCTDALPEQLRMDECDSYSNNPFTKPSVSMEEKIPFNWKQKTKAFS